jgi:hypothetical protein
LGTDDRDDGLAYGQAVAADAHLGHVVDQHWGRAGLAGLVDGLLERQAVPAKLA